MCRRLQPYKVSTHQCAWAIRKHLEPPTFEAQTISLYTGFCLLVSFSVLSVKQDILVWNFSLYMERVLNIAATYLPIVVTITLYE